ncbi:hypothetical protein CQ054_21915 [Ochrobactrum sp. MYb29]|nr:hypothetical protein CQ054_21915 [Ochrobactrum sp. MYb29]
MDMVGLTDTTSVDGVASRASVLAFVKSDRLIKKLERATQRRKFSHVHFDIVNGGAEAATHYRKKITASLIVIEFSHDPAAILTLLSEIGAYCSQETRAIVIADHNDVTLFRELINRGVSDYLSTEASEDVLVDAISKVLSSVGTTMGKAVAFIGAKGGAGSSTIAQNLGWFLAAECEKPTILYDGQLGFGSAAMNFNINPAATIEDLPKKSAQIDDFMVRKLLTSYIPNYNLLASPMRLDGSAHITDEGLLTTLRVAQSQADFLLMDLPNRWDEFGRKLLSSADHIVLVSPPTVVGLRNTKLLIDALRVLRVDESDPLIVINAVSGSTFDDIGSEAFTKLTGVQPAAELKFDCQNIEKALATGTTVASLNKKGLFYRTMSTLAASMNVNSTRAGGEPNWRERLTRWKLKR